METFKIILIPENKYLIINKEIIKSSKTLIKLFTDNNILPQYKNEIQIDITPIAPINIIYDILNIINKNPNLLYIHNYIDSNEDKLFDILYICYYFKFKLLKKYVVEKIRTTLNNKEDAIRNKFKFEDNINNSLKIELTKNIFCWEKY